LEQEEIKIPWKRDSKGRPVLRKATGQCNVCNRVIYDSINEDKIVICGLCTQALLGMEPEDRDEIRNKLRGKHELTSY
jgi:hypothetical protein